jgi:hypothetical protein
MKKAKPAEIIPAHGMPLPSGGIAAPSSNPNQVQEWTFYGASMEGLRAFLALPVQNPDPSNYAVLRGLRRKLLMGLAIALAIVSGTGARIFEVYSPMRARPRSVL